jgi:hypothetical protein
VRQRGCARSRSTDGGLLFSIRFIAIPSGLGSGGEALGVAALELDGEARSRSIGPDSAADRGRGAVEQHLSMRTWSWKYSTWRTRGSARKYGVSAVGLTLSENQAAEAIRRSESLVGAAVEVRLCDYREFRAAASFDAIAV